MAGTPGNLAWLALGRQAAKGTAATTPFAKHPFTGGSINPKRPIARLEETDASRDQGVAYVQSYGAEGSPEFYCRDDSSVGHLLGVLGAIATSGTTNYTHVLTPANALPYMTLWKDIGSGLLKERYKNVVYNGLTLKGEAGGALTWTADVQGTLAEQLSTHPVGMPADVENDSPFYYSTATVTLGGGTSRQVKNFEVSINNNLTSQQTDDYELYDIVPGKREVSVSFDLIFEDLVEYNKFHYGSASPSLPAAQNPTLYETALSLNFSNGANNQITLAVPHLIYEEFPVDPDAGGGPIEVSARGTANRNTTDPIITATVLNQSAGTVFAAS